MLVANKCITWQELTENVMFIDASSENTTYEKVIRL